MAVFTAAPFFFFFGPFVVSIFNLLFASTEISAQGSAAALFLPLRRRSRSPATHQGCHPPNFQTFFAGGDAEKPPNGSLCGQWPLGEGVAPPGGLLEPI